MEVERTYFRTTSIGSSNNSSELFICFPSRLSSSSSSMKHSKSILSPGRAARDGAGPVTLTPSLSRRLRTSGSVKRSPFYSATGRKRGCAFENPEPSSPKVTCIGQVRVKAKKKKGKKQMRSMSRRRSGELSIRKIEQGNGENLEGNASIQTQKYSGCQPPECQPHRNQKWVHLPVSICEALRGIGDDVTCFFPSCFSTSEGDKSDKRPGSNQNETGCGSVLARWLVPVNDGESGRRRDIELVLGGGQETETASLRSSRRHVFEDIEVKDGKIEVKGGYLKEEEKGGTMSICIPPKNALLLMRCRSDPLKMASLMNRLNSDKPRNDNLNIKEESEEDEEVQEVVMQCENVEKASEEFVEEAEETHLEINVVEIGELSSSAEDLVVANHQEESAPCTVETVHEESWEELADTAEELEEELPGSNEEVSQEESVAITKQNEDELVQEIEWNEEDILSALGALWEEENSVHFEISPTIDGEEVNDNNAVDLDGDFYRNEEDEEMKHLEEQNELEEDLAAGEMQVTEEHEEEEHDAEPQTKEVEERRQPEAESQAEMELQQMNFHDKEKDQFLATHLPENQQYAEEKKEKEGARLPECLLLMMCEPKLSMEISKETWVCSTDFIRWLPERPRKQPKTSKDSLSVHDSTKINTNPKPNSQIPSLPEKTDPQQPARSSCSFPATVTAASMASMIEQKLANGGVGYERFVLTRCKSEPMRTAAAKLMPDLCFWKSGSRKVEPHRRAELGVGAAGV